MSSAAWMSMTGYAQAEISAGDRHFKFQTKSVNHRFFEFRLRAPREWLMMENELKNWCKEELQRGSVDLWIEEAGASAARSADDDFAKARAFAARLVGALKATSPDWEGAALSEAERASILARHADVWSEASGVRDSAPPLPPEAIQTRIRGLCAKLVEQRRREGDETRRSVEGHASYIRQQWESVGRELPPLREAWRQNLEERLQKLSESLAGGILDPQRVYQEFVLLADKRDVSEEVQRIDAHLKALHALATEPKESAVGKRLDFLCQELNREWTTLSNKIQDAALNQRVGEAKLTIEKIREQSLNLV